MAGNEPAKNKSALFLTIYCNGQLPLVTRLLLTDELLLAKSPYRQVCKGQTDSRCAAIIDELLPFSAVWYSQKDSFVIYSSKIEMDLTLVGRKFLRPSR